jgi:hypothetical protein
MVSAMPIEVADAYRRVHHAKFGAGTVLAVDLEGDDPKVRVEFDAAGQKTLLARVLTTLDNQPWSFSTDQPLAIGGVSLRCHLPLYRGDTFGVHRVDGWGHRALVDWERLQGQAPKTRLWPVLLRDDLTDHAVVADTWESDREFAQLRREGTPILGMPCMRYSDDSPTEALALAASLTWPMLREVRSNPELLAEMMRERSSEDGLIDILRFVPPDADERVSFALVVADRAWQVPAFLPRTGGNDCPARAELATFMRDHTDRYGPVLLELGRGITLRVERRPADLTEARTLALEHAIFCADLLEEVPLERYARHLLETDHWSFSWD